jgi:hypothetical protein
MVAVCHNTPPVRLSGCPTFVPWRTGGTIAEASAMLRASNQTIDRLLSFFYLPSLYYNIIINKDFKKTVKRSRWRVAQDLFELFFDYKTFPGFYLRLRLWEVEKKQWKYYYFGQISQIYPRNLLILKVEPPEYEVLLDDKTVCEQLCKAIAVNNIPHTHGIIRPDQNYKERIESWFQNNNVDSLIIKPLRGHAGRGIVLANRINENIVIQSNTGHTPLQDFDLSVTAIVQEVIKQDKRMSAFSSSSVNTIRVLTMYTKNESVIILAASMLCGVGESYVSNWSKGGVAVGIDTENGRLRKYGYNKKGTRYIVHPTSNVMFEGFVIPQWQRISELAVKIQKGFPWYRILGVDIALQENGEPILIEVNDRAGLLGEEQSNGPLLQIEQNLKAFGEYDLLYNRHQKELYRMLDSRKNV